MKKKLVFFWLGMVTVLVIGAIQTIPRLTDLLIRTRYVSNVAEFTNAVNAFNALSIDGARRTIMLSPGTYPLGQGSFRLYVSNNICIDGAGTEQTIVTGSGSSDSPMISLYDNCLIKDLTLYTTNTGANPSLGVSLSGGDPTSTNVVARAIHFKGDDDNLWLNNNGTWDAAVGFQAIEWTVLDSLFDNHFDSVYVSSTPQGPISESFNADGQARVTLRSCRLNSIGPSLNATSQARGDVTNIRLLGLQARAELFGCSLYSRGGTNVTTVAFLGSGPSGADPNSLWPGGLYLNDCFAEIVATNLSAGGVGGCLVQNTNGWVFLNGVYANSNNIIGNGTNFWVQGRPVATSTATVGTDAATTEKDLLSHTMVGNTLGASGASVELLAWGSYGATANTKAIRVKIGGVTMLDTAGRAINGNDWSLRANVTRVSPTALKATAMFEAPGFSTNEYTSLTLTSLTNIVWRLTGSNHSAQANDIVLEGYKINLNP